MLIMILKLYNCLNPTSYKPEFTFSLSGCFFITLAMLLMLNNRSAVAQKTLALPPPPAHVNIDGGLTEWGDSLKYYNRDARINYTLANDSTMIYLALRIYERSQQTRIISAGFSFGINSKGKKKEMYCITYPYVEPGTVKPGNVKKLLSDNDSTNRPSKLMQEQINEKLVTLTQIKATGFKNVEYDIITTRNTYGIKAALRFDQFGVLLYEMEIPLSLFPEYFTGSKAWYFHMKINGITRPNGSTPGSGAMDGKGLGGRGISAMAASRKAGFSGLSKGIGGAGKIPDNVELFKSIDFWQKNSLCNF